MRFFDLNPNLLNPIDDLQIFNATLDGHGTYTTEQFVLRLSPLMHEMVEALTLGTTDRYDPVELLQAYSTYLHETIHWWQHVGSSAGLILSLAYPAQVYGSMEFLQIVAQSIGGVKPVAAWAHRAALEGKSIPDSTLQAANFAVNNAFDISFFKKLVFSPKSALQLQKNTYFECVGHSFFKTYGDTVHAINGSCDFADGQFPDPGRWEDEAYRVRQEQHQGYFYGSLPPIAEIGVLEIFEGQARFSQIQFLAACGGPELLQSYRDDGYFAPVYVNAFEEFLRLTEAAWPERYDSSLVGLFLLICDLAINPTRGFPLDIEIFENFISDVDPGARFTRLCLAAKTSPQVLQAIVSFSAEEYVSVAVTLAELSGYDDPREGLDAVVSLLDNNSAVANLMEEHATFKFSQPNMPVRVLMAHYIAFCKDKRAHQEFFCWPGLWMGKKSSPEVKNLFLSHLTLFQDRADTQQIFPRAIQGRDPKNLKNFVSEFYSSMITFDMALQWTLQEGPFKYDFRWLTGKSENPELMDYAKRQFKRFYGIDPDECSPVNFPPMPNYAAG